MKIAGKSVPTPKPVEVYIPRDEDVIRFTCKAVIDFSKFHELCPVPEPPTVHHLKENRTVVDFEDATYKTKMQMHAQLHHAFLIIESLSATPDLTWETVKVDDPDTWLKWRDEFYESGFNDPEINRIVEGVFSANSLDPRKFEEAKERFIRSQSQPA